jgi:hypothetical protein
MGIKIKNRVNAVATKNPVGWHWTWMGGDEIIKNKVISCIESQHRDPDQVLAAFKNKDTTTAVNHKSASEIVKPVYPDIVMNVLKKYPFYWHNLS